MAKKTMEYRVLYDYEGETRIYIKCPIIRTEKRLLSILEYLEQDSKITNIRVEHRTVTYTEWREQK